MNKTVTLWIPTNQDYEFLAAGPATELLKKFTANLYPEIAWDMERLHLEHAFKTELDQAFSSYEFAGDDVLEINYKIKNGLLHVGFGVDEILDDTQPDSTFWSENLRFVYQPGTGVLG